MNSENHSSHQPNAQGNLMDVVTQQLQHIQRLQAELETRDQAFKLLLVKVENLQLNGATSNNHMNELNPSEAHTSSKTNRILHSATKHNSTNQVFENKNKPYNATRANSEPLLSPSPKKGLHQIVTSETPEGFQ
ncbi:hypothetical protein O181_077606 [Austropuccinia psidii MF-1]|uniref:Uncharacterized protein n=1 Tax=Austropuccinia psidii MF-1 TaxID=1389203 RepID=A0A9Q3FIE2_9BASI|nr:hypothetical protein [Austropuccinia psidii MF-1]